MGDSQKELEKNLKDVNKFIGDLNAKRFLNKLWNRGTIREKFTELNDNIAFLIPVLIVSLEADTSTKLGKTNTMIDGCDKKVRIKARCKHTGCPKKVYTHH